MNNKIQALKSDLRRVAENEGSSYEKLFASAEELVLFGSRATGDCVIDSDWDILCVSEDRRKGTKNIQVISKTNTEIHSDEWIGSELASHIAEYGIWLEGIGDWKDKTYISQEAIVGKQVSLRATCRLAMRDWEFLSIAYRLDRSVRFRRDLQRLLYLRKRKPVPPSKHLDDAWEEGGRVIADCELALRSLRFRDDLMVWVFSNLFLGRKGGSHH